MFGGGSAGSFGASFNLDSIADTLESYGIKTVGYLDSSAYFDYNQLYINDNSSVNFTGAAESLYSYYKYKDWSYECAQDYAGKESECFIGANVFHYLKHPFMMVQDQYDYVGLATSLNRPFPCYRTDLLKLRSEAEYVYALNLAAYTRSYMKYAVPNPD